MQLFLLWLYAYQTKAMNPGNTVIASMNPVFDHLNHCENFFIFGGHLGHSRSYCICCYCCISLDSYLLFDMNEAIVKTFSFLEVIQAIRGCQRSLEGQTLDLLLLLDSLGSQLSFDMYKAIIETFSICGGHQRSLEVIRGH